MSVEECMLNACSTVSASAESAYMAQLEAETAAQNAANSETRASNSAAAAANSASAAAVAEQNIRELIMGHMAIFERTSLSPQTMEMQIKLPSDSSVIVNGVVYNGQDNSTITISTTGDSFILEAVSALTYLNLAYTAVGGDIIGLQNMTSLTRLDLFNTEVVGDIVALQDMTELTYLDLYNIQVYGDISALQNITTLDHIYLAFTEVDGDISALQNLTSLTHLDLGYTDVDGDITAIQNLTELIYLGLANTLVTYNDSDDINELLDGLANGTNISNASIYITGSGTLGTKGNDAIDVLEGRGNDVTIL